MQEYLFPFIFGRMRRARVCAILLLSIVLFPALPSHGQKVNGSIVGTVVDSSGASLPGAQVTITDTNTAVSRTFQTDASGYYSAPDLAPGTYQVSAEKAGFATAVHTGVSLFVDSIQRVDITLAPGTVTQTVNVSAAPPVLQTDTADTGRQIETAQVSELPLSTGRNFQNLLNTVPGAGVAVRDHSTFFNPQNSMASAVNGNSSMYNDFDIEGIDDNQRTNLLQIYIPPIEAIQGVDITTSNYDPQQGSALGAVTNVILKSGTNQFHGEVYEFYTGNRLDARSYFNQGPNGQPYHFPHIVDNYFGGNLGGPIQKGKTFFFVSYLEHIQRTGETYTVSVPTAAMRRGDFSNPALTPIYDPMTGDSADCLPGGNAKLCGTGRTQFPGNIIPANRISPVALKLLSYVPLPNTNLSASGNLQFQQNLILSSVFSQSLPDVDVKIDRFFSNNDHLSGRFSFAKPTLNQPGLFGVAGGPLSGGGIGGAEGYGNTKTYSTGANWIHSFSSTLLSEARFGVSRFNNVAFPTGYGQNLSESAGIPGANVSQFTSGISTVSTSGAFSDPMIGGCSNCPWTRAGTIIEVVENMTKVRGNHTFEWGADYHRVRDDLLLVGNPTGAFNFNTGPTSLNGGPSANFANTFASLLLSTPTGINRGYVNTFPAYRQNQTFVYGGDKWQVSPKLTLNLGLRWEYYAPPTPHFAGGFSNYNGSNNTLELAGVGNVPRNLGMQKDFANFGPRIGVDYRLSDSSVVRAGFGMSTMSFPIDLYAYNYPIEPSQQYSNLSSFGPAILSNNAPASFESGFPALPAYVPPANGIIQANTPALLNQSYFAINLKWRNPYLETWNFAYQRDLPWHWVMDLAYVGNHGVHTPIQYNQNAATSYGLGAKGQPEFQAFGRTASTTEYFVGYSSSYHALQIKLDRKFSNGFSMTNSYTYSKAMGFASENADYPNGLLDYVNQNRNYAPTDFNQTHIFNESYSWQLPFGPGQRFVGTGIASKIFGGFQLTGMWELTSGFPLNFSCTCTGFNTPGNQAFPNMTGHVQKLYGIQTKPWFSTANFSVPAAGTQGNVGNYISSGPGFFNLDASLFRRVQLSERFGLELRTEWLHATNTPQFSNPNTTLGSSSFGLVSGATGGRIVDLAGKITF
ncbi:MAG TPA: TonB-dependent receptor [Acidobacteriaceae bacterium]|nr:TonB-dependent receptor [Acidobacteriaceae bacterium]